MLAASGCTAGRGRFLGRCFFSAGAATTSDSSAGDACSIVESPVFDLVASRQCSGWALPFSLPLGRSVLALLPQPAAARVQVQCLASEPLPTSLRSWLQPFSSSVCEFESSRRSEIDPEDSPKSPPVLALRCAPAKQTPVHTTTRTAHASERHRRNLSAPSPATVNLTGRFDEHPARGRGKRAAVLNFRCEEGTLLTRTVFDCLCFSLPRPTLRFGSSPPCSRWALAPANTQNGKRATGSCANSQQWIASAGKNTQPDESSAGDGSAPGIDATI